MNNEDLTKNSVYLFDWGDTLMKDYPEMNGKMCDWDVVTAIDNAFETLKLLSKHNSVYIATGAADSSEDEIYHAFKRVNLHRFIEGVFCQQNVGFMKGEPEFLGSIIKKLSVSSSNITMVGDSFEKDILPALNANISPVWFNVKNVSLNPEYRGKVRVIQSLAELIES